MYGYNHVGRPTNEEVSKRKKIKFLKITLFLVVLALLIVGGKKYFFAFNKKVESNELKANTSFSSFASRISKNPIFSINSYSLESNALQGSAGYNNRIFYVTTLTAGRQSLIPGTNKKNVGSVAHYYDLNELKNMQFKTINNEMTHNYKDYKNNDATINEEEGRVYFLYYANDSSDSKIVYKSGSKAKTINTRKTTNKVFYNLGYSNSDNNFVSMDKNKIYFYNLDNDKVNITSTCKLDNSLHDKKSVKYNNKVYNIKTVLQGITMTGKILYLAHQNWYYESANPSKVAFETNNINVYDTRNCSSDSKLEVSKNFNLGKASDLKYELESIFFMNGKLHLGYNNEYYNKISFYTLNADNTSTVKLSAKKTDTGTILTGKIKTKDNHSGLIYYSFCKYADRKKCKFKSIVIDKKYRIIFDDYEIKYKVEDGAKGTYYFHTLDIFGKRKKTSVKI